jgi:hypothetical protein
MPTLGSGCQELRIHDRKPLLEQWIAQLAMFLGIEEKEVCQIGGGKRKLNGRLDVAMIQSLVRKDKVEDLVAEYGQVIVDECHHLPAVSFERVLSEVKARYVVGLTATPQRRDGHQPITEMQLGPVRFKVDAKRHDVKAISGVTESGWCCSMAGAFESRERPPSIPSRRLRPPSALISSVW